MRVNNFIFYFLYFAFSNFLLPWVGQRVAAQQCNIIYITPNGASSGAAGTKTNPANLFYGLSLANATNNQLWLAFGTYSLSAALNMSSDIAVEGGFDPSTWEKSNWYATVIERDNSNVTPSPSRLIAIACTGISNFRLQDITIKTDDAAGSGVSTYGIYTSNCSNYSIVRCIITAGNASDGADGNPGVNGVNGVSGQNGQNGDEDGGCCTGGGNGGSGGGGGNGGQGGNGAPRGSGSCPFPGGSAPNGQPGSTGSGTGGGLGGNAGQGNCGFISIGCDASPANWGTNGFSGANGTAGVDGTDGIPTLGTFFTPGDGTSGLNGANGAGGGGGGGGGSQGCLITCFGNTNGAGAGGGGGGEGGQGGNGATGGNGGGGSFGIYMYNNGGGVDIKDCFITSGQAGYGGAGGFPGGSGGNGGNGGSGGGPGCDIGTGGNGGDGGDGGKGGNGGNGAPGLSLPVYEDISAPAANQSDMRSQVEPFVKVKSTGCTWSDIEFSTTAIGIIQWYFDGGTVPLTAIGSAATVQYSITGRHSVTLVVDGVPYMLTDFVGIFNDGTPYLPQIVSSDTVICPGNAATFASTYTGLTYQWVVYDNTTANYSTPTINHTFNAPGNYLITLQTTSSCCGKSKIDSFNLEVAPYLTAQVFVTATQTSACFGEIISFGAVPVNGGINPTFDWYNNGFPLGINASSFSTSLLLNGDAITCTMTSSYPCIVNSPATSSPITISINPQPIVMCSATSQYLGAKTGFSTTIPVGSPPYGYLWNFGDGSYDTASTPLHTYGGTGTYAYSVSVTDANGCTGTCNGTVNIIIPPYVYAGFDTTGKIAICNSTTVTFTDTTKGNPVSWLWDFGDGFTSTLQNPQHIYNTPGSYTVTLIAGNGIYSDTAVYPNYIFVFSKPVAGLRPRETLSCLPLNTQFFDESSGAMSWLWDFGDGGTSTLQNPFHTFYDDGYFDITLIVGNNYGCYDTIVSPDLITVYPLPTADFDQNNTSICINEYIIYTDNSIDAVEWHWAFGDGDSTGAPSPIHAYHETGIFTVRLIVKNYLGCSDTIEKQNLIYVWPNPDAGFSSYPNPTTILSPKIAFTDLTLNEPAKWVWYFGDKDTSHSQYPVHEYPDTGTYVIKLWTENIWGCRDSTTDSVVVLPSYSFFIPNTFTPNGDAVNDVFIPKFVGMLPEKYEFYVYDRWGQLVFESHDPDKGWSGELPGGRVIMMDVYAWVIYTYDMLTITHRYFGHVTVKR